MDPVLTGLAANPSLSPALADRLIACADDDLASVLAGRRDLSPGQAAELARRSVDIAARLAWTGLLPAGAVDPAEQPEAALALLASGPGRPEWARVLARSPLPRHRERLAGCPGLPGDVADLLAADPEPRVAAELASRTDPGRAARMARHPHAEVRRAAAVNEATPPDVLAALLTGEGMPPARHCLVCDREPVPFTHDPGCRKPGCGLPPGASCDGSHESAVHAIRQHALRNPSTPASAAAAFVGDPSVLLRQELAARPDLPPAAAGRLAADPVPWVRENLAGNPAIGETLIRALAADPDPDVRRRLAHHPAVPLDVLAALARTARTGPVLLPRIAAATPEETDGLASSPDPALRMLTAQRRDLPARVRDALARDADAKVLKSIAPHPGLPEALLLDMLARHGTRVAAQAAANPDASPALLETIARQQPPARKALREIARHPRASAPALLACLQDPRARAIAAGHPALPVPAIVNLLASQDGQTAEAAAANPSLPTETMNGLIP